MKKTQRKDARRNIRANKVSWLSVVVIAMLATAAFLSITWSAAAITRTASDYYKKYDMWDLELTSTLLMDGEDLETLRALPGVERAEPSLQMAARIPCGRKKEAVMLVSLPQELARPEILSGRLPETDAECMLEAYLADRTGLGIGDSFSVENDTVAGIDPIRQKSFTVTGIFRHPDHISFVTPVTPYVLVRDGAFDLELLDGTFMLALVRVKDAPEDRYGAEYLDAVAAVRRELDRIRDGRAAARTERLHGKYQAQIDDAQAQLDAAGEKLRAAQAQLEDGRRDLEAAAEKLGVGLDKLDDGIAQIKDGEEEYREGAETLREGKAQLDRISGLIREIEGDILEGIPEEDWPPDLGITYQEFKEAVESGKDYLIKWIYEKSGYNAGLEKLRRAEAELNAAWRDWYYSGEEYLDGVTRYEQGKKKLEEGERDYAEGLAEWEEGSRKLQEARDKLALLGECRWIVLNNEGNPGYMFARVNANNYASLSSTFSLLFVLVAALVIYATVGRMVEEQSRLVGATKAMGLYNREIFGKYLLFGLSSTLLGMALGIALAYWGIQSGLLFIFGTYFTYGVPGRVFLPIPTAEVIAGGLLLSVVSVWLACSRLLRAPAIRLMQGDVLTSKLKRAKRSAGGSLYTRLILLNMRADLKRVTVTVVSIAGSCILLMIGFSIKFAMSGVFIRQFDEIITHDLQLTYEKAEGDEDGAALEAALRRHGLEYTRALYESRSFAAAGQLNYGTLIVAPADRIGACYRIRDAKTREPMTLPASGVLIPLRMHDSYGLEPGDVFSLNDSRMIPWSARAAGIFENHFPINILCSPEAYEEICGTPVQNNCFLIRLNGADAGGLEEELSELPGYVELEDARADRERLTVLNIILSAIVALMMVLAGMLSLFILLNLSNTYIQQKTRELTIMRINGFTTGECIRYAACDLAVTTVLGIALGLAAGAWLGWRVSILLEQPNVVNVRTPDIRSFIFSFLITALLSALINSLALRKIKRLKLSDLA